MTDRRYGIEQHIASLPEEERAQLLRSANGRQNGNGATGQGELWPQFITAKELLSLPPDPTRWIWENTLPVGGASVLVSKPKLGKSTFAANLSIAVARGVPFLGRNTRKEFVAYCSLDASLPEMAETFIRFGLQDTDPIAIHAGAAPGESIKWLREKIKEMGARLVIVDTLQRFFRFKDLNDYSQVTNVIEPLIDAAREQSCHIMFTHHAKKDTGDDLDSAIGSTAIRAMAYSYLHLKRLPDSERRILRSDQRGGKNIEEMAVGFDRLTGWLVSEGTRDEAEIEDLKPKILEMLEGESESITETEVRRAIEARGWKVGRALRGLLKAHEIERTGKGKRGDPFRYSVCPSFLTPSRREKETGLSGLETDEFE